MKDVDKTTVGKSCEIGMAEADGWVVGGEKQGIFAQMYAFNIFSDAFIARGCMGYRAWMWHLSGAEVSEKTLKCRIYGRQEIPSFVMSLCHNDLRKRRKTGLFPPEVEVGGK